MQGLRGRQHLRTSNRRERQVRARIVAVAFSLLSLNPGRYPAPDRECDRVDGRPEPTTPQFHTGYPIPSMTPTLLYIGVARATSAKLSPGPLAPCCCLQGLSGCECHQKGAFCRRIGLCMCPHSNVAPGASPSALYDRRYTHGSSCTVHPHASKHVESQPSPFSKFPSSHRPAFEPSSPITPLSISHEQTLEPSPTK